MNVEPFGLRDELVRACADAGLDPGAVVAWIVAAPRPDGATPIAYLQPAGRVREDTVLVFRAVGVRVEAFERIAHRLAVWAEHPGIPECALGPMIRHELEHACRWERSGTAFYEADERLRDAADAVTYSLLPTEREANAAASAYAAQSLTAAELDELRGSADCATLVDAPEPPADVVGETLAALGESVEVRAEALPRLGDAPVIEVVIR